MEKKDLKKLPSRALMLAQMGRQKVSKEDHKQRKDVIQSLVKKSTTPRKAKIERVSTQLINPVNTPPSKNAPPKKHTPPAKRIKTSHTPMSWSQDYRQTVLEDLGGVPEDQDGVKEMNVNNENSTKISVTSYQGSDKNSEISVTVTNQDNSYSLNLLHSTLMGQSNMMTNEDRPETGGPSKEVTRSHSPDLFSDPDDQLNGPGDVTPPQDDITEDLDTVVMANNIPEEPRETENTTVNNTEPTIDENTENNTENNTDTQPQEEDIIPGQSNASPMRKGQANTRKRQTIAVRQNRKRKIETEQVQRSDNPDTIKRNFKNKVRTIATGGHELHRNAKKTPSYLILLEDNVHSKEEIRPRVTAGKVLTFGEGDLARQFLQGQLKFNREKFFFHVNPFNTEEKVDFSDLVQLNASDVDGSQSDLDTSARDESSVEGSHGDKGNISSDTDTDNGCYQMSKQSKKDTKKAEKRAKKAKAKKQSQERNNMLSNIDITNSLPPSKRKSVAAKKKTASKKTASKKTSSRKKK